MSLLTRYPLPPHLWQVGSRFCLTYRVITPGRQDISTADTTAGQTCLELSPLCQSSSLYYCQRHIHSSLFVQLFPSAAVAFPHSFHPPLPTERRKLVPVVPRASFLPSLRRSYVRSVEDKMSTRLSAPRFIFSGQYITFQKPDNTPIYGSTYHSTPCLQAQQTPHEKDRQLFCISLIVLNQRG